MDCDSDSLIYLSEPIGPACHTNAPTCYFTQLDASSGELRQAGDHHSRGHAPMTTLFALERTIAARRAEAEAGTAPGVCGRVVWEFG
jgi:phosphoribosyl-ATP pyrophosphohydrolase/phosphoribosyl-AMP cyclohydrolase